MLMFRLGDISPVIIEQHKAITDQVDKIQSPWPEESISVLPALKTRKLLSFLNFSTVYMYLFL